ncbi:MAG: alpha/beta hydrolase [Sphingomonadales bacterium 32-68-7]|nr:MAG: alpha/beta hydrolase [Sphingomonadales bacterium 12-68-11]OYX07974.1 MAG: alpha/beta hydrolase [Sphingomonadales bacterium 32-68-7]
MPEARAPRTERFASFDGTELAVHRQGTGRPAVLLHGLYSSADMNWIRFGHAARLAEAGFEAIMPDLRAHGQSAAPHDASAYPPGVLVRDLAAIVTGLGLQDFDLVGFSLGARTAVGGVIAGLAPRRLVLAGMGLESLSNWDRRARFFVDAIDRFGEIKRGDAAFFTVQFMKTMKIDPVAARLLLTEGIDDPPLGGLARLTMPTLIVAGDQDRDNGSPTALAEALPNAAFEEIPGTHMSCVTEPPLGEAIVRFLAAP